MKQKLEALIPILNGLIGDKLPRRSPLNITMSFRLHGKNASVEDLHLRKKLKGRRQHVTVFVHGLMFDEGPWQMTSKKTPGYGARLERDFGHTVLYVRYNSGLHISKNGKALSKLLQELFDRHGRQIKSLTLVGYSMGGLIVRSAGHYARKLKHPWTEKLSRVFLLGAPHSGSHWEQLGHLTSFVLNTLWIFQTRIIGRIADQRSDGIKDLRLGYMVEEDWKHKNASDIFHFKRKPIKPLPGTRYHIIAGSLFKNEKSLLTLYFGDGLVGSRSAFEKNMGTYKVFPLTSHFQLLSSAKVYQYMKSEMRR